MSQTLDEMMVEIMDFYHQVNAMQVSEGAKASAFRGYLQTVAGVGQEQIEMMEYR